jgi:hypothetical protein
MATLCAGFKKTRRDSFSIGVRIAMIRCIVYLLWIFKMFHGLMNNPVLRRKAALQKVQEIKSDHQYSVRLIVLNWLKLSLKKEALLVKIYRWQSENRTPQNFQICLWIQKEYYPTQNWWIRNNRASTYRWNLCGSFFFDFWLFLFCCYSKQLSFNFSWFFKRFFDSRL